MAKNSQERDNGPRSRKGWRSLLNMVWVWALSKRISWRVFLQCAGVWIAILFLTGIAFRATYTDITAKEGWTDHAYVAEVEETVARNLMKGMDEELALYFQSGGTQEAFDGDEMNHSRTIIRVTCAGQIEYTFHGARQLFKIDEVKEGDQALTGQKVYLTFNGWRFDMFDGHPVMSRGMINVPREGEAYLALCAGEPVCLPWEKENIPMYSLLSTTVAPLFAYGEKSDAYVTVEAGSESTYVPYGPLRDNEYFGASPEAIRALKEWKRSVMEKIR